MPESATMQQTLSVEPAAEKQAGASIAPDSFSLAEARKIVGDLFEPRPAVYWTDFLVSLVIGYACYGMVRRVPTLSALQIGLFVVACLALYRVSLFIHELVHLRTGSFKYFRIAWNLLCGIPFLMPSFLYYTHLDHHRRKHYGTKHDGEYLPLTSGSVWGIVFYLFQPFVIPVVVITRFLLFTPLSWISPRFRQFVQRRMSSMVMDPTYIRPLPTDEIRRVWRIQEAACFLFCLGVAVLLIRGRLPLAFLVQAYATGVFILTINAIRTLGAHRFLGEGEEMTFVEQLVDSVNYPRLPLLTEIWAPVGLRFHATHHLFPGMPYHSLPAAHARLMRDLPANSPYRLTEASSLRSALAQLWTTTRTKSRLTVLRPASLASTSPVSLHDGR